MDSQWLITQFAINPDKTKAGLAEALGLGAPAISKILNGTRQIKAYEYAAMRRYFGLPGEGGSSDRSYVLRPLPAQSGLAENESTQPDSEWVIPASILSARTNAPSDKIKIFKVADTAMEPDFRRGENVLVDMTDCLPSPPGVFVVSDGYGQMARQCEILKDAGNVTVKISTLNTAFEPQILFLGEFKIIGRVIAKLQML